MIGVSRSPEKKELNPYLKNENIKNFKFYRIDLNKNLKKINDLINIISQNILLISLHKAWLMKVGFIPKIGIKQI